MSAKITTETGKEMLRSVTPTYNNDDLALSIFEANGKIMDEVGSVIEGLKYELFPQNATWTLPYWEQVLKIKHRNKPTTAERVQAVLFELNKYFPVTKHRVEQIVNKNVRNGSARIVEVDREYRFDVNLQADSEVDLASVAYELEEIKPAHLDYAFRQITNSSVFCGASMMTGEEVAIYPWSPTSIEVNGRATLGSYVYDYDTTSVFPKEGVI